MILRRSVFLCVGLLALAHDGSAAAPDEDTARDVHSYAQPAQHRIRHLELDLHADFSRQRLHGDVILTIDRLDPAARELVLDTRDLTIRNVTSLSGKGAPRPLGFRLGAKDELLGQPLFITLPASADASERIRIDYETSPQASALQWLSAEQTAGKRLPFLYSQSQPIHARSWIPLQDTPQVRLTYSAHIRTPRELRAVMSAANDSDAARDGDYSFDMPQPIPAYLIALAVGDLDFRRIGPRTGVYAEPATVGAAAGEFADTEAMLERGEQLFGPYRWGRYDLVILPPSFMWGGMENPRVSFITPTVIAGDRSLVSLIAHELAHSWSGNLVTNATWRDTWLNEGFTTHLERRLVEVVYGKRREAMEDVLGTQSLQRTIAGLTESGDAQLTRLTPDLQGRDPGDAFSDISYEKGRLFLRFLEARVGRERLDDFLKSYFDAHAFRSITTEQFRDYLRKHLLDRPEAGVTLAEVDEWLYQPGVPATAVLPVSDAFIQVDEQRTRWLSSQIPARQLPTAQWTTHEWLHFLDNMPPELTAQQMQELDAAFNLTASQNAEVAHSWLLNVVRAAYAPGYARLEQYLTTIGRRKLTKDLYEELAKTPAGLTRARDIYTRARPLYQLLLRGQLDALLLGPPTR